MKADKKTFVSNLIQWNTRFFGHDTLRESALEEPPLRSELFSADQMESHGKVLAHSQQLAVKSASDQLLRRLADNEVVLVDACRVLATALSASCRITPAGEWLLDNFYLIEEQIRTARRHLPKGYSRELPRLASGPSAGLPRVYDIALEIISHGDGRVDPESLSRFVAAYQSVNAFKLGELWAIPIMLRLALIENLRRVAVRIVAARIDRELARAWADQMIEIAEQDPKSLILVIADMARSSPPVTTPFVAEFARRLQGQGSALALPLTWIEQLLSESHQTIEQLVQSESQQQAIEQVSIGNSIGSLRFLGAMDWRAFVERMSLVEQTLSEDSGGTYANMDFATRDRYRHAVERIARRSSQSEGEVARLAIQLAQEAAARKGGDDRSAHVGFYLVDQGLPRLERAAGARLPLAEALSRIFGQSPLLLFLGAITLITALSTGGLLVQAQAGGVHGWLLALTGVIAALCSSQLAVALVNWLATLLRTPHALPRMDFADGIPPQARTLVVVPTMLTGAQSIEALVEALEVRFLANRDENLYFGLLTDFLDAHTATTPQDEPLLQLAHAEIDALNQKYSGGSNNTFFLFHRPRCWNPQEQTWMGYERKRGKLADLNALLRGASDGFSLVVGDTTVLSSVKYVITLDTDTQLPRDSARQFAGTLAHPLNRACYDAAEQRVCQGYGILQPRVSASLPGSNRSRYAQLFGGEPGIDPYTRAVSDVYQDLFHEGSFIGKGIYDVDAFEQALNGRFAENRILSHDLLEGCYARAGLLSDVQLYEGYPTRYSADVSRRHRWIRGDWQLLGWLLPYVAGPLQSRLKNPLSALSRWKIFDNLRRSLTPAALTLLLLLGWTVLPSAGFWTASVIGVLLIPSWCAAILGLLRKSVDVPLRQHYASALRSAGGHFARDAFNLACLPYEACFSLDAILRTAWRMLFTQKRLLQWTPSSETNRHGCMDILAACRAMWIAPLSAIATAMLLAQSRLATLAVAGPILVLWLVSPVIAWWISRPLTPRSAQLTPEQTLFLRKISRKTWAFFDTFVGPEDHWLPPDNYQEYRAVGLAHRTSPTNMGLALLANLSAYDFGYIPAGTLMQRTANTLGTMGDLKRYQGHFFNWYDTQSLKPLHPVYVSTVDSGNLVGYLLTLRPGLLALPDQPILGARWFHGLHDTFRVLLDATGGVTPLPLVQFQQELESACAAHPAKLAAVYLCLDRLATQAAEFADCHTAVPESDVYWWAQTLARQCRAGLDELLFLIPWLVLPATPRGLGDIPLPCEIPTLRELAQLTQELLPIISHRLDENSRPNEHDWLAQLRQHFADASRRAHEQIALSASLALQLSELAHMEYGFLYDRPRHLLAIGFNVGERQRDASYYDLLASEARLCSFVAIAQGQVPQASWFALGRLLVTTGGAPVLLSWSGSMFEYLMPLLVMPSYENTLIDQTYRAVVARQIEYGRQRGVPWGISESGYNTVDVSLNYQYRAFGVPGLGLKSGLAEDLVVAPYASALALMVAPEAACLNLQRLSLDGVVGKFGFYEAVDYTPSRLPRGQTSAVIQSYMAHHQGMSLLSFAYLLLERPMQQRFESDPLLQANMLLLHERIPKAATFHAHAREFAEIRTAASVPQVPVRILDSPDTPMPEVQLLSNGRYHVMVTNAGGGYSRWKDFAVTRWREDSTRDHWGAFCYLRDMASGEFWSNAHQPTLKAADRYAAIFSEGRAEFRRRDHEYDTHTDIVVSPEDDIELRRVRITNRSRLRRTIEVTSYSEVVLASAVSDAMHPAFSNLFVQTEIVPQRQAILYTRRPRALTEQTPWMFHLLTVHEGESSEVSYETDRAQFIGRGNTLVAPSVMVAAGDLAGGQGAVLDPIAAIRLSLTLASDASATLDLVIGMADSREACLELVEKYHDRRLADRVFDLAWTHSQVVLRQLNASEADAQLYGRLANSVIYAHALLRADPSVLSRNCRGQSGLWAYAISGDLPIVLLQIKDLANIDLVRQLVQAHAYWRLKGLAVDLVIWNEDRVGYRQLLQDQIFGLIAAGADAQLTDRPGGIFVRYADQIAEEDRILLQSVARAIISDSRGDLAEQLNRRVLTVGGALAPARWARVPVVIGAKAPPTPTRNDLIFFNGMGGFTPDGREYVITLAPGQTTPAPWVNVLANSHFGCVISESGQAYTFGENAHEFRLTPWHNDPVSDAGGEAFYLRDEENGQFWSPTLLPTGGASSYVSRHGFGYSVFEHDEGGIHSELMVYVALDASIKFSVLKVRNESGGPRKLSATGYVEWVLGDLRPKTTMHVISEVAINSGALFARNPYNTEFPERVAFFAVDDSPRTSSCDRTEFIGRNGTLRSPAAMRRARLSYRAIPARHPSGGFAVQSGYPAGLSGKVGAGLDPCAAIQIPFELADGQEREIVFKLGLGRNSDDAKVLVQRFHGPFAARAALDGVWRYWQTTLGAVQVATPDPAVDVLANGWLLYQTIVCRLWGRSGYYQSGGAFGFRDQLQDVMALVHATPQRVREHLLLCAAHQFVEGDVQHWWHPPSGRGVRTHCSDDYLWLPLATCRYVQATGDFAVLDEQAAFLEGHPVNAGEDSYYDLPGRSIEAASLYQHCARAILHGLNFGEHGLPLIGSGDWNDGMNLVGLKGQGESVWLAFFLCEVLQQFSELARRKNDQAFAERCLNERAQLCRNIEQHGWDGAWYRRAYFDDGTPLGSASNPECQIDSIAQSWSVLSGADHPERARQAMQSLDQRLVRREEALIQLLDPPFNSSILNPGYIMGYVPGVRENGGQYTHGAIWAAMAFARLGEGAKAWELLGMINPVNHGNSPEAIATYKVEPYVIAADVYAVAPHTGRGGWSWYTGSAGWMYRLILESLLGLRREGDTLRFEPCLPSDWQEFTLRYRYGETYYPIVFSQTVVDSHWQKVMLDGVELPDGVIRLVDDGREHRLNVQIGRAKTNGADFTITQYA